MKILWSLIPPVAQAVVKVTIFFISLGWVSYGAILLIVKAEGQDIRREVMTIRGIDMAHIDNKFHETQSLIRDLRKDINKK